jgi:hypothetical protein
MEKSESIKELATALCKFQSEVEKIKKDSVNPFFRSKYADLSSILDVIREPLVSNNLSFVQFPSGENGLTTMLMHTSGEYIQECYTMKPSKNDPQGLGSAITYQRRYALGAILGLNIDEDDDGNAASQPNNSNSSYNFGTDNSLAWVSDNMISEMIKFIAKGKKEDVIKSLVKYRWSKKNEESIINALDNAK